MVVVTIVIAVLLVVALVYIVALLRSHADILRRLTALEEGAADGALASPPEPAAPPVGGGEVITAAPISGSTLRGDSVTLSFGPGSPMTLIAFLTSGCTSCAPLWAGLHESPDLASLAQRVTVVTHDATRESPDPPGAPGPLRDRRDHVQRGVGRLRGPRLAALRAHRRRGRNSRPRFGAQLVPARDDGGRRPRRRPPGGRAGAHDGRTGTALRGRVGLGRDRARPSQPVSERATPAGRAGPLTAVLLPAFLLVAIAGAIRSAWSP